MKNIFTRSMALLIALTMVFPFTLFSPSSPTAQALTPAGGPDPGAIGGGLPEDQQTQGELEDVKFTLSFEDEEDFLENTAVPGENRNISDRISVYHLAGNVTRLVNISTLRGTAGDGAEGKDKIFDGSPNTKWLSGANRVPSPSDPVWIEFDLGVEKTLAFYELVSANDAPARHPADWVFYGSNDWSDDTGWTAIDSRTEQEYGEAFEVNEYEIQTPGNYRYYRLEITRNQGNANMTQFADLNLFTGDPDDDPQQKDYLETVRGNGPSEIFCNSSNTGWDGARALTVSGYQLPGDGASSRTVIVDGLNIPVTEKTRLRYVIFPQFVDSYDYDFYSMHMLVDLMFTDGTYLSDYEAEDFNGVKAHPVDMGQSRILTSRQWNEVTIDLVTDAALVGKTIAEIHVYYETELAPEEAMRVLAYIDDLYITEVEQPDSNHFSDYVITTRGTNSTGGVFDGTDGFSRGLTIAGTTVPHGFNFWAPVTNSNHSRLYDYESTNFRHMTISHEASMWIGDRGNWEFMVNTSADPFTNGNTNDNGRTVPNFSHRNEIAKAHYYSVEFPLSEESPAKGSRIEVTPTDHAAVVRFTYDPGAPAQNVILDGVRANGGQTNVLTLNDDNRSFTAINRHYNNGGTELYVYGEFDREWDAGDVYTNGPRAALRFPGATEVIMRVATSYISHEQAKANLEMEIGLGDNAKSFDDIYGEAQETWDELLSTIQVVDATQDQLISLYSSMYRLYMYPNNLGEYTGQGNGTGYEAGWQHRAPYDDHEIMDGKLYYNNGFWDTYRTAWTAYSLLTPDHATELLNGLVRHYDDQGWIPRWIAPGGSPSMVGTSSDVIFGDAIMRGIDFDHQEAYESAIRNAATVSRNLTNGGRQNLQRSMFQGYTDIESDNAGFSWAIEGYINDYGIAQIAKELGYTDEYLYYMNRAQNYVKLFNPDAVDEETGYQGWFMGKYRDGRFSGRSNTYTEELIPRMWGHHYTETNAWNMSFSITQDGEGLASLYGGREELAKRLDTFFWELDGEWIEGSTGGYSNIHEMQEAREVKLGQYGHNNQPSHHIPYMYLYAGRPSGTQEVVRDILNRVYTGSRLGQGYIGDEDNGEMSAWYIMSALGIYPVNMGSGEFAIGSPLYKEAVVRMDDGSTLTIKAPNNSPENIYVQGVRLNGAAHTKTYFTHDQLQNGGDVTIEFDMGPTPSSWGTGEDDVPPSISAPGEVPDPLNDVFSTATRVVTTPISGLSPDNAVYAENGASLGNLFDNNGETAAALTTTDGAASLYYKLDRPVLAEMYTLMSSSSANNSSKNPPQNPPSGVALYGSADGVTWVQLDERTELEFKWERYTRPFAIDEEKQAEYQYYRFDLTGGATISLNEIELLSHADMSAEPTVNIALNKPVWAGSEYTEDGHVAENAVDGDTVTRWGSAPGKTEDSFVVDLQGTYEIETVHMLLETAPIDYTIQFCTDEIGALNEANIGAADWTVVADVTGWDGGKEITHYFDDDPQEARYIMIDATEVPTGLFPFGFSIFELEVYGNVVLKAADIAGDITSLPNPRNGDVWLTLPDYEGFTITVAESSNQGVIGLDGKITQQEEDTEVELVLLVTNDGDETDTAYTAALTVTVPSAAYHNAALNKPVWLYREDDANPATNAVDGNHSSHAASVAGTTESWFVLDLQGVYDITDIDLYWEYYPIDYTVEYTMADISPLSSGPDSQDWIEAVNVRDNAASTNLHGLDTPITARYIMVHATKVGSNVYGSWGMPMYEIEVTGKAVAAVTIPVTGVELDAAELTLAPGESETLTATVTPQDATNRAITWTSDAPEVAEVDQDGLVTAVSAGEATITVTTEDGGFEAQCRVTVTEPEPVPEYTFAIITEVLEYGQDVIGVAIDAGETVDGSSVDEGTFAVTTTNYNPDDGSVVYAGRRDVIRAYVNDEANVAAEGKAEGRYIILELEYGHGVDGASTLVYTGGRNLLLVMDYAVEQRSEFALADGSQVAAAGYEKAEEINLIVDDFAYGEMDGLNYRLYTPEETGEPQPLVVWLHGSGESGDNNEAQIRANMGATAWASPENQAERPAYVLAPQAGEGWSRDERATVAEIIDMLLEEENVDAGRIYIAGCSMGGSGTWNMLLDYPDVFAASIITATGTVKSDEELSTLTHIPLWLVHTGDDAAAMATAYERFVALGGEANYTNYPAGGNGPGYIDHWSWVPVLNNLYVDEYETDYMTWLFDQGRGEEIAVESVRITGSTAVRRNQTTQLTAVVTPDNASTAGLTWTSLNPAIATIDQNGVVTGRQQGFCFIQVNAPGGVTAAFLIEVTP